MSRDNRKDPTDYAVYCLEGCGLQFLSQPNYMSQLMKANSTWRCPNCHSEARWDDDCRTTNPPEDEEPLCQDLLRIT